ncbi:MAG: aldehyde dehydrogenase family protein [Micromonosporaceae bacterium]
MTAVGEAIEVRSPIEGRVLGQVPRQPAVDVERTAAALRAAQTQWEALGVPGRVRWLRRYRDWLLDNERRITRLMHAEVGKPLPEAEVEYAMSIDILNYYARRAKRFLAEGRPWPHSPVTATRRLAVAYRPYPVVGLITPWNFPVGLTLFDALPALAAGAAVLAKPSEFTPLAVRAVVEGWAEIGAPPVFDCVTGLAETGEAVVDGVDFVQFTGSTRTGRAVAQRAAARLIPCGLELGGKDPAIVLADADVAQAAAGVAYAGLSNTGQMCTSAERIYVEAPIYEEFVARLVDVVGGLRQDTGDGYDTDLGPLVTTAQHGIVSRHVADAVAKGATARTGGEPGEGRFYPPTVLTGVDDTMDVMREETFGPVLPVVEVADAAEAVRRANATSYGLSAYVWTRDKRRGREVARQLEVGAVNVNDVATHLACFPVPQAGWKQSGIGGRSGGAYGIRKYTRPQTLNSPRVEMSLIAKLVWYPYAERKAKLVGRLLRFLSAGDLRRRLERPS